MEETKCIQIHTTASSKDEAKKLANLLLAAKTCACVKIISDVESHYSWKGKSEVALEWLLLITTTEALFTEVESLIESNHSYEIPEIIAFPVVESSGEYIKWVRDESEKDN